MSVPAPVATESTKLLAINRSKDEVDVHISHADESVSSHHSADDLPHHHALPPPSASYRLWILGIPHVGPFLDWLLFPWDHPFIHKETHYESERLALFGDAVASIIATFMVLPLVEGVEEYREDPATYPLIPLVVTFLISYQIIGFLVYLNAKSFERIGMHPVQVVLNLLYLLALIYVPLANSAIEDQDSSGLSKADPKIFLTQGLVLGSVLLIQVLFTVSCTGPKIFRGPRAFEVVSTLAMSLFFFLVALLSSLPLGKAYTRGFLQWGVLSEVVTLGGAYVLFFFISIGCTGGSTRRISKERVLAFSDGIYAIASTLAGIELRNAAYKEWKPLCIALVSFSVLAFEWYLHYLTMEPLGHELPVDVHRLNHSHLVFVVLFAWAVKLAFFLGSGYIAVPFAFFAFSLISLLLLYLRTRGKISKGWAKILMEGGAGGAFTIMLALLTWYNDVKGDDSFSTDD